MARPRCAAALPKCLWGGAKIRARTAAESPSVNPDALLGTWKLSFLAADAPWSEGGEVTGTVTFKYIENCYYEGQLQAAKPAPAAK